MDIDIERLKWDAEYWDKVAPLGATHHWAPSGEWYQDCGDYALAWIFSKEEWVEAIAPLRITRTEAIPRPTKPEQKEWVESRKAQEFGLLVNPRNQVMVYGQDHIGKEIEVIQYLPSEQVYVVRFEWGLGCVDYDMIDFRTKAEREREELANLLGETVKMRKTFGAMADDILAAGWQKGGAMTYTVKHYPGGSDIYKDGEYLPPETIAEMLEERDLLKRALKLWADHLEESEANNGQHRA